MREFIHVDSSTVDLAFQCTLTLMLTSTLTSTLMVTLMRDNLRRRRHCRRWCLAMGVPEGIESVVWNITTVVRADLADPSGVQCWGLS